MEHVREVDGLLGGGLDPVEAHEVGDLLGEVDHVVQLGDQVMGVRTGKGVAAFTFR